MDKTKHLICSGLLSCWMTQPLLAAPVYYTSVGADGLQAITLTEGTGYSFSDLSDPVIEISNSFGEASASGNSISVSGTPALTTDSGFLAQYYPVSTGSITYSDLIFSDTTGSGASTANVSLRYAIQSTTASDLAAQVFINGSFSSLRPPPSPGGSTASNIPSGNYSSNTVTVPLNVPISVKLVLRLKQTGFSDGNGNRIPLAGNATMRLLSTPFQLDQGITVNSAEAGIFNNHVSAVPLPASLWLFVSGIAGLLGIRKQRRL